MATNSPAQRKYSPPTAPSQSPTAAKTTAANRAPAPAPKSRPAPAAAKKSNAADYDIVSTDEEFTNIEKAPKEINGKEAMVSLRLGAIWKGRPRNDGTKGAAFVVLGMDGAARITAKMFVDEEGPDGATYTLRQTEAGGDGKRVAIKGQDAVLARVWWPSGGLPQFSFTTSGAALLDGRTHGLAYYRGNGKKNG